MSVAYAAYMCWHWQLLCVKTMVAVSYLC